MRPSGRLEAADLGQQRESGIVCAGELRVPYGILYVALPTYSYPFRSGLIAHPTLRSIQEALACSIFGHQSYHVTGGVEQ